MHFSILRIKINFKKIEENGVISSQVEATPDVLADSSDLFVAYSIFETATKSLSRTLSEDTNHTMKVVFRISYQESDGFVLDRDVIPTSFNDLEMKIMEDLRFAARQQVLSAIAVNLNAINNYMNKNAFSDVDSSEPTENKIDDDNGDTANLTEITVKGD